MCTTSQAGCNLSHPLKIKVHRSLEDVKRDDPFQWDEDDEEDSVDDGDDDEAWVFWRPGDVIQDDVDSLAAQREERDLALLDAVAATEIKVDRDFVARCHEIIGDNPWDGLNNAQARHFIEFLISVVPLAVAADVSPLEDEDIIDRALETPRQRQTMKFVFEMLEAAEAHERGDAVDATVLGLALTLKGVLQDAGVLSRDARLASWDVISLLDHQPNVKLFYQAAREAGKEVTRQWVLDLARDIGVDHGDGVYGLAAGTSLRLLAYAIPLAPPNELLLHADVLQRAAVAAHIDGKHLRLALGPLLNGDPNDPALAAVLTRLRDESFHTGAMAEYDKVVDPEGAKIELEFCRTFGTDSRRLDELTNALHGAGIDYIKPTVETLTKAGTRAPGAALGHRDILRWAAQEITGGSGVGLRTSNTLGILLKLVFYSGTDDATLQKKEALIAALDGANVHRLDVAFVAYDVFIAKETPACVTKLHQALQTNGKQIPLDDVVDLFNLVKSGAEGLPRVDNKPLLEVLARLAASTNALTHVEPLAQACLDVRVKPSEVLMHLLNPLRGDDGTRPTNRKKATQWDERRRVAPLVLAKLRGMGLQQSSDYAKYVDVQRSWRDKEDQRQDDARVAAAEAAMNASDDEEEQPYKKMRRSKRRS